MFYKMKSRALNTMNRMCREIQEIYTDDRGIGVVEMILILVVLIGLVIIFKEQLTTIVNNIFKTITSRSGSI